MNHRRVKLHYTLFREMDRKCGTLEQLIDKSATRSRVESKKLHFKFNLPLYNYIFEFIVIYTKWHALELILELRSGLLSRTLHIL